MSMEDWRALFSLIHIKTQSPACSLSPLLLPPLTLLAHHPPPPSLWRTHGESLQMLPVMMQTAHTIIQNGSGAR